MWCNKYFNNQFLLYNVFLQIFDAATNTWKVVDERSHTDFVEKINEAPKETVYIEDITDTNININNVTNSYKEINDLTKIRDDTTTIETIFEHDKNTIEDNQVSYIREQTPRDRSLVERIKSMLIRSIYWNTCHAYAMPIRYYIFCRLITVYLQISRHIGLVAR